MAPMGETVQDTVSLREAAVLMHLSEKQMRRLVTSGQVRAVKAKGPRGPQYVIERGDLPERASLPRRVGLGGTGQRGSSAEAGALAGLLQDLQGRHEAAVVRLGALEAQGERVKLLEARADSLGTDLAQAKAEAATLRQALRTRTALLVGAAIGALAGAGAVVWLLLRG